MSYVFLVYLVFSLLSVLVFGKAVVCLCGFVFSLSRFVASAWFYSTCIGLTCVESLYVVMVSQN